MTVESLCSSRVLVVEDESLIAEEIKDRLERMGVNVVAIAATGEDAVLRAGDSQPEIVLMDIRLRGSIDGIEAARRITELYQIPVVYLTAHADDATLSRAKRTSPYGYLLKPFEERDLRIALEMALYKHSAEIEMYRSRELYAKTLAGIIEGIITSDAQSRITFMNPAAEHLTKWPIEEAIGREISKVLKIIDPITRATTSEVTDKVLKEGNSLVLEEGVLISRDGAETPVFDSISPIRDRQKKINGAVLVLRDLTEKKKASDALREAHERIFHMQKLDAIGRLAGGIAHDVSNMMMIIRGNGDHLLTTLTQSDPSRIRIEAMCHAADRSSTLARQLLAFSRKQGLAIVDMDLNESIENICRMLAPLMGKNIEIKTRLSSEPAKVMADRAQTEQILMNLAINSKDAMPEGGTLSIETTFHEVLESQSDVSTLKPGKYVVLSVSDTGFGMTEEVKSHLFEPFYTTKEFGKGTGMGLATVFGIVTQLNGTIDLISTPGQGTTFKVFLRSSSTSVKTLPNIEKALRVVKATILVVEDEPEIRELVKEYLLEQEFNVLTAADGQDALTIGIEEKGTIDLLLTDSALPRISGKVLAAKLCAVKPALKVIFMSAYSKDDLNGRSASKQDWEYVQKPFSREVLLNTIARVLHEKQE